MQTQIPCLLMRGGIWKSLYLPASGLLGGGDAGSALAMAAV